MKFEKLQSKIVDTLNRSIELEKAYSHYHAERKELMKDKKSYLPLANEKCFYASKKCSENHKKLSELIKEKEHFFSCNYIVCPEDHIHGVN
jgi:hypothetical protein